MPRRADIKSILIIGACLLHGEALASDDRNCAGSKTLLECLGYYKINETNFGIYDSSTELFAKLNRAHSKAITCVNMEDVKFLLNAMPSSGIASLDEYMTDEPIKFTLENPKCLLTVFPSLAPDAQKAIIQILNDFTFDLSDTSAEKNKKLRDMAKQLAELKHA